MPEIKPLEVLEAVDVVRRRPGMYIGNVHDGSGLHHMLFEVIGNVIDQHLAGRASRMAVWLRGDEVVVEDDGDGFGGEPLDGVSALERISTLVSNTPTWDGHFPHVHVGASWQGLGLAVINFLSAKFEIDTVHRGRRRRLTCLAGRVEDEREVGATHERGTRVRFRPDPGVFASTTWDVPAIRTRLFSLACLNPGLTIQFEHAESETLRGPRGLADLIRPTDPSGVEFAPFRVVGTHDDVLVEVALMWRAAGAPVVHGFVSQLAANEGTHIAGFWDGLCDAYLASSHEALAPLTVRNALGDGLVAAVHVALYDPQFGAPTRNLLLSPEGRRAVSHVLRRVLGEALQSRNHHFSHFVNERVARRKRRRGELG